MSSTASTGVSSPIATSSEVAAPTPELVGVDLIRVSLPPKSVPKPSRFRGLRSPMSTASVATSTGSTGTADYSSSGKSYSLAPGETSPSQRIRGERQGSIIVNVVQHKKKAIKVPLEEIVNLEEDGLLECEKVGELLSMLTGENVTGVYYTIRCAKDGDSESERNKFCTTTRLVIFEDGPNPFIGGMAVDAYVDGAFPPDIGSRPQACSVQ